MHTIIDFNVKGDERGNLVALEQFSGCPFDIKRVYYIWGTLKGVVRGKHAHKDLDTPKKGLYIKNKVWREFTNFSKDCVVMVLASERYNPEDYINDYEEFIKEVRTNK